MGEYEKSRECPKEVAVLLLKTIEAGQWELRFLFQNPKPGSDSSAMEIHIEHMRYLPQLILGFSWQRLEDYLTHDRITFAIEYSKHLGLHPLSYKERWNRLEELLDEFKAAQSIGQSDSVAGIVQVENAPDDFSILLSRGFGVDYGRWVRYIERENVTLKVQEADPKIADIIRVIWKYMYGEVMQESELEHTYLVAMNPDRILLEQSKRISEYDITSGSQFTMGSYLR